MLIFISEPIIFKKIKTQISKNKNNFLKFKKVKNKIKKKNGKRFLFLKILKIQKNIKKWLAFI